MSLDSAASEPIPATYQAPASRAGEAEIRELAAMVSSNPLVMAMLESAPCLAAVLDSHRQIVAANRPLLEALGRESSVSLFGTRPGEALDCVHAHDEPGGCGTAKNCTTCGAGNAIHESQRMGVLQRRECRITVDTGVLSALDFDVVATPVELEGRTLTVCMLRDISDEKRRRVLERYFFHDVLNTAGGIAGASRILVEDYDLDDEEDRQCRMLIAEASDQLIEEIQFHRQMTAAEAGDLQVEAVPVSVREIAREVADLCASHPVASGRRLVVEGDVDIEIQSEPVILRRVLANLVKNALEATERGGIVTVRHAAAGSGHVVLSVHNSAVMPEEVRLQIFQRSFSTKGASGRGIGTYSVKLFGERYLGGVVDFESKQPEGTTFRLTLPVAGP